ncbi:MAG TPA: nucleotidyltransferase, partial [Elusimicrobia bacterium]|nr:nucleotidyltransferase [Elusimicrobiota bacterium]
MKNNIVSLNEKEKLAINELVQSLKKLYGSNLSRIILYGSKARGDATEGSDIDIMIVLKEFDKWEEEFEKVFNIINEVCYQYEL